MSARVLKNSPDKSCTLLIWDAEGEPPVGDWTTVLWCSFRENDDSSVISIPKLVEEQAEALRKRYLAWIYELGELHINSKRLIDHLELRAGFSYWWMTLLAQKFNASGTSQIDNAIKAFAFESLVSERKVESIVLISNNDKLASTLKSFCQKLNCGFEWNFIKSTERPKPFIRLIYHTLPYPFQALIFFIRYLIKWLPLFYKKQAAVADLNGEISFIDVLVHLDRQAYKTGSFISNYWTSLVDMLSRSRVKTNWLHNFFHQESIPSPERAQELIKSFNKCNSENQFHELIEANLSISVFIRALKDYFRTCWISFNLSLASCHFMPAGSALDFWSLFKHEWIDSLRGKDAMINCLRISLYEKIFHCIPYQKLGVYIQENQPWEMALIHAWRAAGHGKLIGVPHTTVRFWDLRYFYDHRSYEQAGNNVLPSPDLVAVNGPLAKKVYLDGGYPATQVVEVEALRFLHLLKTTSINTTLKHSSNALKVLVCGDFLTATNNILLSWITVASQSLPPTTSYILKPHPAYPISLDDFPLLKVEMTDAPLSELLPNCDVVFTSNITSVAVDTYYSGIPVVQILDGKKFNMSPLRGLNGVVYVRNPMELVEALVNAKHREQEVSQPYFYLDTELPRWRQLLGLTPAGSSSSISS